MLQIRLRPLALEDLDSIWDYSVDGWDTEQAEKYLHSLNQSFEKLATNPSLGKSCHKIRQGYWKLQVGRHLIFYCPSDETLEIVRILHERMDILAKLSGDN